MVGRELSLIDSFGYGLVVYLFLDMYEQDLDMLAGDREVWRTLRDALPRIEELQDQQRILFILAELHGTSVSAIFFLASLILGSQIQEGKMQLEPH